MMTTFAQYAARGKTDWWRYPLASVLGVVFWLIIVFVIAFVLAAALMVSGHDALALLTQAEHPDHPLAFYIGVGVEFGFLPVGVALAVAIVHRKSPRDIVGRWPWRLFWIGAGLWLALAVIANGLDFALAPRGFSRGPTLTPTVAAVAFVAIAVQTFAEEFVFRGYLTQALLRLVKRPVIAALASGALFGAAHIPNGAPQAAGAFCFGVVTALIAIRTGGLAFGWGMHLANNYLGAVVVVSAGDVFHGAPGLIIQNTPRLMWWDTAIEAALLLVALWLVWRRPGAAATATRED